jgi:hypothetical protein
LQMGANIVSYAFLKWGLEKKKDLWGVWGN